MLDKFLNKVNSQTIENNTVNQKVAAYNQEVLNNQKPVETLNVTPEFMGQYLQNLSQNNVGRFDNFQKPRTQFSNNKIDKFKKLGSPFSKPKFDKPFSPRPNIYQTYENQKPNNEFREYIDDGSYFCAYAIGGTTLVCYKNKEKIEFVLDEINHPDKNNYLAKRANYFLNEVVKKQKIFVTEKENGKYDIFLSPNKEESINQLMTNEGFHNSVPYDAEAKDKKTSFKSKSKSGDNDNSESSSDVKEKKNYAYGLFATNHNTFEALFNKNKITLKLDNLDSISKEDQKICKSMIYDFVSKKSIILKFIKEENGVHFAEVFNKEGECLNQMIANKNFKSIKDTLVNSNSTPKENPIDNEQLTENEWNWTEDSDNDITNEKEVHDNTDLPAIFKKTTTVNPNSPFAKKKLNSPSLKSSLEDSTVLNEENLGEELNVPEVTALPAMFRKTTTNPNSPFAKKQNESISQTTDSVIEQPKKKLSFGKR